MCIDKNFWVKINNFLILKLDQLLPLALTCFESNGIPNQREKEVQLAVPNLTKSLLYKFLSLID